jgi:F-type H+-transporting ATPase subunit b
MENESESTLAVEGEHAEALDAAGDAAHGGETLGGEVLHVAETSMPQLDVSLFPNLIFWLVVSIVALYLILTRVALPRISTIIAERNDAISNDLEQAAIFKRRAEEAEAAYNAALAKAREDAQGIAAGAKAQVGKELAKLMAKADAEIAAKSAESEARIREIEASAAESVAEVARSTAAAIVEAVGPRTADAAAISRAVDERLES